jgi:kynurenine formamidase
MVGRGVLIDVAGYRGVDAMDVGQEITMADVRGALQRQGMADFKFSPGDIVLFRTGWTKHWITDNKKYNSGEPGIGIEVARWLSDVVQAGGVGADTWATEVLPNPDPASCLLRTRICWRAMASPSITRTSISTRWRGPGLPLHVRLHAGAVRRRHRLAGLADRDQMTGGPPAVRGGRHRRSDRWER